MVERWEDMPMKDKGILGTTHMGLLDNELVKLNCDKSSIISTNSFVLLILIVHILADDWKMENDATDE